MLLTLVTGVRPIKDGFINRFLRLSDKMLVMIVIEKKREEDKSVHLLTLKIAFFGFFENDNILNSTSNTVTKSGISPQRKLGSLQNLKLKLIRH